MKTKMTLIAAVVALTSVSAHATSKDCGCIKTPTAYDKTQDVKIGALQDRDAQLAADIHQVHINTLGKYSESWGLEDRANIGKLQEEKLDKSVFAVDQQRQDKALAATVTAQAGIDAKQTSDLKGYADQKATSAYTTAVQHTDVKVARADADRKAGDDALGSRIDVAVSAQAGRDAGQDERIQGNTAEIQKGAVRMDGIEHQAGVLDGRVGSVEVRADKLEEGQRVQDKQIAVTDGRSINNAVRLDGVEKVNGQQEKMLGNHETRITQNSSDIVQLYSNGEYAQSRIDAANANIEANRAAQVSANKRIAANSQQLANHEQRLGALESQTNSRFANMDKRIDDVRDRADAGVASVAAMANIPQVTEYQSFAVGAGVGSRHDQQALAVGFSARATSNMVVKASVSTDTTDSFTFGAGASIGW